MGVRFPLPHKPPSFLFTDIGTGVLSSSWLVISFDL